MQNFLLDQTKKSSFHNKFPSVSLFNLLLDSYFKNFAIFKFINYSVKNN